MVCVKTDDCNKDMTRDGIDFVIDGEWLRADKTTLGAHTVEEKLNIDKVGKCYELVTELIKSAF